MIIILYRRSLDYCDLFFGSGQDVKRGQDL